jgi:hypothetical protein
MRAWILLGVIALFHLGCSMHSNPSAGTWAVAIHGGAGVIERPSIQAADEVIHKRLAALNGSGGVIVASPTGEIAWSFNTPGMYRASIAADRPARISIFKDEP